MDVCYFLKTCVNLQSFHDKNSHLTKGLGIHWSEDKSWSNKNLTYGLIKRISQLIKGLPRS